MTKDAAIRAGLVAALGRVEKVGQVHDRERYATDAGTFKALYTWENADTGKREIRGWFVAYRSEVEIKRAGRTAVLIDWEVVGYVGFVDEDASEHTAVALARAVKAAIEADGTLGGACNRLAEAPDGGPVGVRVVRVEPVSFAGALAHRARLSLTTLHFA